jgi:hypothetical protein
VVREKQREALQHLRLLHDKDAIYASAIELRLLDMLATDLERFPQQLVDELKEEGDEIYG